MLIRLICAAAIGLSIPLMSAASRVETRKGAVCLIAPGGTASKLTEGPNDSAPMLSSDGQQVVYVRSRVLAEPDPTFEIRVHNVTVGTDRSVLRSPISIRGEKYSEIGRPQFSADGKTIYFLFNWSVTTHGLARFDMKTGEVKFVMPAFEFYSVVRGKYGGDLVVQQRRAKLATGYYYLYYLYTPDGKEIGVVGENQADVDLFLDPDGDQ